MATSWGGEGGGGAGPSVAPEQLVGGRGAERQRFHEGLDPGRRGKPLLLPPEPAGTSKNGSGQELSTGRPLPPLLAGDSEGTGYLPGHKGCFQLPGSTSVLHLSLPDPRMSPLPRIP